MKMNEIVTCPFCGFSKSSGSNGIPEKAKAAICPKCRRSFPLRPLQSQKEPDGTPAERAEEALLPVVLGNSVWEDDAAPRSFPGLAVALLRAPYDFFRRREPFEEQSGALFSFGLLFGSLGTMLVVFWQFTALVWGLGPAASGAAPMLIGAAFMLCVVLTPIWVVAAILINTLFVHFCLCLVGAGREGLIGTFRVVAYSQAAKFLGILPFVGGPAAFIWQMVIQVIGLREVHRISSLRLLLAVASAVVFIMLAALGWLVAWPG
jgi:hypothetical protein